jgi:hypothetical protein
MQVVEEAGGHERDFRNVAMADVGFFEKWGQVIREKEKRKRGQGKGVRRKFLTTSVLYLVYKQMPPEREFHILMGMKPSGLRVTDAETTGVCRNGGGTGVIRPNPT